MRQKGKFLTAEWRKLLMINYEIDAQMLKDFVPPHTEIDYQDGKTFVSLIGFMFLNTKVLGLGIPFHRNFEEINLRFYVQRKENNEWRRGVVFIKEIVPRFAIANMANLFYNENYVTLATRNLIQSDSENLKVAYNWKFKGKWNYIKAVAGTLPREIENNSMEEFITEHYWGYSKGNKYTFEYQVEHPRWDIYPVKHLEVQCDYEGLYGKDLAECLYNKPASVLLAEGSEIIVRKPIKLRI